jgi:glycosyltransferase involved in cell wall biosynthesis
MHQRKPEWLLHCALVLTVSRYCIGLLQRAGVANVYSEPLYGVADAARGDAQAPIVAQSPYDWDRRKLRDTLLGWVEPLGRAFAGRQVYEKKPAGLTLGIVSLLVPIKQFPLLFSQIAPVLARHDVNLEIFGAGGYAQVRDLKHALKPVRARTRFWGYQSNAAAIYPRIDYLLAGLPEKEALGLNVLEAQACGTPVLAPQAPPFTETMVHGASGFLYRDPREDEGADFERTLASLIAGQPRPDPRRLAAEHLARFSYPALVERLRALIPALAA